MITSCVQAAGQTVGVSRILGSAAGARIRAGLVAASLALFGASGAVQAEGDPAAGETKAYTCLGCHGVKHYINSYPSYHVPRTLPDNIPNILLRRCRRIGPKPAVIPPCKRMRHFSAIRILKTLRPGLPYKVYQTDDEQDALQWVYCWQPCCRPVNYWQVIPLPEKRRRPLAPPVTVKTVFQPLLPTPYWLDSIPAIWSMRCKAIEMALARMPSWPVLQVSFLMKTSKISQRGFPRCLVRCRPLRVPERYCIFLQASLFTVHKRLFVTPCAIAVSEWHSLRCLQAGVQDHEAFAGEILACVCFQVQ